MAEAFKVETTTEQAGAASVCVMKICGKVDRSSVKELDVAFAAALAQGGRDFVLDFGQVEYVSSAGLRLLLKLRKAALDAGGRARVAALHREIRENVFDALGFSRLFEVYATVGEAVASFGGKSG